MAINIIITAFVLKHNSGGVIRQDTDISDWACLILHYQLNQLGVDCAASYRDVDRKVIDISLWVGTRVCA